MNKNIFENLVSNINNMFMIMPWNKKEHFIYIYIRLLYILCEILIVKVIYYPVDAD